MRSVLVASTAFGLLALVPACDKRPDSNPSPTTETPAAPTTASGPAAPKSRPFDPGQLAVFAALPASIERPDNVLTPDKVALGRMLWFDARLSKAQDVSCNSCHDVTKSGADDAPISTGTKKQKGTRNTPTIFNAAGEFAQGWDARWTLVEELVVPHAAQASVMGVDEKRLVDTVSSIPAYAAAFKKSFPDAKGAVAADTIAMALGAYARKLLTPSKWDTFLGGDQSALTDDEKAGLGAFMDASCTTCHAGKYVGAAQNQKLGVAKAWPASADVGRFAVTKEDVDRGVFKVPTLRNVTKTAPYLHDGSIASLDEITKLMSRHQVGKELTDAQTKSIVTFLGALAADPPKDLVAKPELPASGPKTPKPD
ncbi:MAG: Cytochrome peroxidase [Labilithrix sp.]|nr:Cytochrome peroxidase [Labilithrix sp.]